MEDQGLAWNTRLSLGDVHRLRLAAGISDDDLPNRIVHIDDKTLGHHEILLTIYSRGDPCLTAEVFAHHGRNFQQLWSLGEMPGGLTPCALPHCPAPGASATKAGEVVITVPARRDGAKYDVCDDNVLLTYRPVGTSLEFASERKILAKDFCGVSSQFYYVAFSPADEGNRIASIEVMRSPSGSPSALVFQKSQDGPVAMHFSIPREIWLQSVRSNVARFSTPSECIESATSAPIERTRLPLTGEQVQALLDSLAKIDLRTDRCPRRADGECALIMDGVHYFLQLPNGRTVTLTDTRDFPEIRSENPALSDWVYEVLKLAHDEPPH
jgi:hypothetical protein